ncbi:Flp pilus assembly protein CpaB [Pseudomonas lundensis]|uniref:Flp pilus assembly protein CpaB n=1 Tax=Pseudomonas lundensis TaxID=86185 RepID=A0ABX4GJ41_9PSED|nr:Flp pilus assembly protein CpaB [Pseudomonas lundensis]NMZ55053.1 Flp pilus assembly protein CpaB [Pseudomonas lundensis]OZY28854.1 Flp pilus assembly protein CpaB [Pseudomonas lundensis]OZY54149.1 Flp pilus assembly protein CpaB [Pseudomonas lundensis]
MNNRRSLVLAAILFLGAIAAGFWGLMLARQQPVPPAPVAQVVEQGVNHIEDQTKQSVVVLTRDVVPHVALTADDLTLEKLRTAPAGSLTSIDQAVGRTPWRGLNAGTWLNEHSFEIGGPLARMIRPDERALAVAIDEVAGAAGQFGPGDYVDILLFLRQDTTNPESSTQVVLPAVRVLSIGDELGLTSDGQPVSQALTAEQAQLQTQRRVTARTVVLAIPEPLVNQLMLAAQAGTLRLAVRSAQEQRLSHYWSGEKDAASNLAAARRSLYQFNQLAMATPANKAPLTAPAGPPRARGIEIIRGTQAPAH